MAILSWRAEHDALQCSDWQQVVMTCAPEQSVDRISKVVLSHLCGEYSWSLKIPLYIPSISSLVDRFSYYIIMFQSVPITQVAWFPIPAPINQGINGPQGDLESLDPRNHRAIFIAVDPILLWAKWSNSLGFFSFLQRGLMDFHTPSGLWWFWYVMMAHRILKYIKIWIFPLDSSSTSWPCFLKRQWMMVMTLGKWWLRLQNLQRF